MSASPRWFGYDRQNYSQSILHQKYAAGLPSSSARELSNFSVSIRLVSFIKWINWSDFSKWSRAWSNIARIISLASWFIPQLWQQYSGSVRRYHFLISSLGDSCKTLNVRWMNLTMLSCNSFTCPLSLILCHAIGGAYDFAISFAGENRDIANELHDLLSKKATVF